MEFITRIEAQELPPVEPTVTYYGQMEGLLGQGSALVFDCLKSQTGDLGQEALKLKFENNTVTRFDVNWLACGGRGGCFLEAG